MSALKHEDEMHTVASKCSSGSREQNVFLEISCPKKLVHRYILSDAKIPTGTRDFLFSRFVQISGAASLLFLCALMAWAGTHLSLL
jgi:hypothetical protein